MDKKYIEINENTSVLINRLDSMLNQIEVKGESVYLLFNSRLIIKELIESSKTKKELFEEEK